MQFIPPPNSSSSFEVSDIFGMVKLSTFLSVQLMRTVQSRIIYSIVYGCANLSCRRNLLQQHQLSNLAVLSGLVLVHRGCWSDVSAACRTSTNESVLRRWWRFSTDGLWLRWGNAAQTSSRHLSTTSRSVAAVSWLSKSKTLFLAPLSRLLNSHISLPFSNLSTGLR